MFSERDPYDYLGEEGRPTCVLQGIGGGKAKVHWNFNPWAFFEILAGIARRRFGAEATVADATREADSNHVPRSTAKKNWGEASMKKKNSQTKTVERVCRKKKKPVKTAEQKNDTTNKAGVSNTGNL